LIINEPLEPKGDGNKFRFNAYSYCVNLIFILL
jgi:hypothetical protein